jgi:hypothetical protein
VKQRQAARDHIYERITNSLGQDMRKKLDDLLETNDAYFTSLHILKKPQADRLQRRSCA